MIDFFTTQITNNTGNTTKTNGSGLSLTGIETEAEKIDFLKFILTQLEEGEKEKTEFIRQNDSADAEDILHSKAKNEKADLELLKLALLGQDVDQNLDQKLADLQIERIALKQENRVEMLTKLVNHLTSGLPKPPESGTVTELVQRLNQRLEKLEASLASFRSGEFGTEGSPFQALIATGLNPAQLTDITTRIEEVENKLGRELTVEDLIAGVGNIIPAPGDDDHEFSAVDALSLLVSKEDDAAEAFIEEDIKEIETEEFAVIAQPITQAIDIKQNRIALSSTNTAVSDTKKSQAFINTDLNVDMSSTGDGVNAEGEFNIPLSNAEFRQQFGNDNNVAPPTHSNKATAEKNGLLTAIQNTGSALTTSATSLLADFSAMPSTQMSLSEALGFDLQTGTPFNQTVQAAHLVSSPNSVAGQTHPATNMVAAQITKSAENGNTNRITLQLEPADLGRVEVQLEFGRENTVKANLIVEKPETLLMLQRDASVLEKALQNAGLETNSDSLNYEMAAEDHAFGSNKDNQNGQSGKTGTDLESTIDEDITTTMTWDVDPETGHVHYSILA